MCELEGWSGGGAILGREGEREREKERVGARKKEHEYPTNIFFIRLAEYTS